MKRALWIAAIVAIPALLVIGLLDEPLNARAKAWLADAPTESRAYDCLLGLGATPDQDGCAVGAAFRRSNRLLETDPPGGSAAPLMDQPLLCRYREAGCLRRQQARPAASRALLSRHAVLRQRYLHFLSLDDFAELTPATQETRFPPYGLLMAGARLQSLAVASGAEDADTLPGEIDRLRDLLARPHNLISKLTVVAILEEKVRLAALLVQTGRMANPLPAPLGQAERNMDEVFKAEFRLMANLFLRQLQRDKESMALYERLRLRAGLRPKMTVNRLTPWYRHYMTQAMLPPEARSSTPFSLPAPGIRSRLTNPVGNRLAAIKGPDFMPYIARLDVLDARLRLFHWLAGASKPPANPWRSRAATPRRTATELCFDAPPTDGDRRPCLPLLSSTRPMPTTPAD